MNGAHLVRDYLVCFICDYTFDLLALVRDQVIFSCG